MTWQTQSFQNSRICPLPARPAILVSSSLNGTVHPLGCSNQKPGNRVSIVLLYPPFSHSVGQWVLSILAPNLLISFCLLWHHPSLSNHHILLMWTMTVISYWYSGPQSHCPSSLLGTLFPPSTGALHKLFSQFGLLFYHIHIDLDLIPELGRSPGERNGNPFQYFCLENSMDRLWG